MAPTPAFMAAAFMARALRTDITSSEPAGALRAMSAPSAGVQPSIAQTHSQARPVSLALDSRIQRSGTTWMLVQVRIAASKTGAAVTA